MFLLGRDLGLRVDTFGTIHAWANYWVRHVDDVVGAGQYTRGPRVTRGYVHVGYTHSGGWGTRKNEIQIHAWHVFLARRVDAAWKWY